MTKLLNSAGRVACLLLATLSAVGMVVSFSLLFGLESIEIALASKETLANVLGERMGPDALNSVQAEIKSVERSVIEALRGWRYIQKLDFALWGLMFVASCVSLFAYSRADAAASLT